jgi:hypothetical protein
MPIQTSNPAQGCRMHTGNVRTALRNTLHGYKVSPDEHFVRLSQGDFTDSKFEQANCLFSSFVTASKRNRCVDTSGRLREGSIIFRRKLVLSGLRMCLQGAS